MSPTFCNLPAMQLLISKWKSVTSPDSYGCILLTRPVGIELATRPKDIHSQDNSPVLSSIFLSRALVHPHRQVSWYSFHLLSTRLLLVITRLPSIYRPSPVCSLFHSTATFHRTRSSFPFAFRPFIPFKVDLGESEDEFRVYYKSPLYFPPTLEKSR